jgi:inner membrane protein
MAISVFHNTILIVASVGHIAVGLLAGRALAMGRQPGLGQESNSGNPGNPIWRTWPISPIWPMLICSGLALLPDFDYVGVMLGIADAGPCGHRGATHSMMPPLVIALLAAAIAPRFGLSRWRAAVLCGLAVASHALLDAMTASSRGVPLLWPISFARFEMPWRPIPNAPCGLAYLSRIGLRVASIELLQFSPILLLALWPAASKGAIARPGKDAPNRLPGGPKPASPASVTQQAI